MANNVKLLVFPSTNAVKTKAFMGAFLGVEPYVDSPYYVGYKVGDFEVGIDPHSSVGPIAYTEVADINASLKAMTDAGAEIVQMPKDVGNGMLISQVKNTDGSIVGFRQLA